MTRDIEKGRDEINDRFYKNKTLNERTLGHYDNDSCVTRETFFRDESKLDDSGRCAMSRLDKLSILVPRAPSGRHKAHALYNPICNLRYQDSRPSFCYHYVQLSLGFRELHSTKTMNRVDWMVKFANAGDAYASSRQFDKAIEHYEKCKDIAVEVGDRKAEGLVNAKMGDAYLEMMNPEEAAKCHQKSLDITKEIGDRQNEGNAYGNLGNAYYYLGKHHEAIQCYENCLKIKEILGDRNYKGIAFRQLGDSYQLVGNYQKALNNHQKHLNEAIGIKNREEERIANVNMGSTYDSLNDHNEAIKYHQRAREIAVELCDREEQGLASRRLGYAYWQLAQYDKATSCFKESLEIAKSLDDKQEECNIYQGMGNVCTSQGDFEQALDYHQKHLGLAIEIQNKLGESRAYTNLGNAYHKMSDYHKALSWYEKSLAIAEALEDKAQMKTACVNVGNACELLGRYDDSINYFEKSLSIARETDDKYIEAATLGSIGEVYRVIGKNKEAIEYSQKSIEIASEFSNRKLLQMEATANGIIGMALRSLGNLSESIKYHEKRLHIVQEIGDKHGEAHAYGGIGNCHLLLGNHAEAIKYLEKQLDIAKTIGDRNGEANAVGNLGGCYMALGQFEKAIQFTKKVLDKVKEIGDKRGEAHAYMGLGLIHSKLSNQHQGDGDDLNYRINIEETEKCLRESLRCYDQLFESLQGRDEMKISILDTFIKTYKMLTEVCIETEQIEEALLVAEYGRARALEDLLNAKYSLTETSVSRKTTLKYGDVEKMLSSSSFDMLFFVTREKPLVHMWVLAQQTPVFFKESEFNSIESLSSESAADEAEELEDNFLEKMVNKAYGKMVVRQGFQCEDRSLEPTYDDENNQQEKDTKSRNVYDDDELICDRPLEYLFEALVAPIQDKLTQDEIVIIPDGPLFKVPFAALRDSTNESYLSDSKRIRLAPSLTALKILTDSTEDQHSTTGALIVGNPDVGEVIFRSKKCRFSRLPGAEREAERISETLGVSAIIGQQATKQAIRQRLREGVAVIHFAAHGSAEGEIALSPAATEEQGSIPEEKDYLLTIKEVQEIGIKAQLVVLSCCHSGRGEIKSEGVVGMSRAFLAAGARAVVASLWAIDDEASMVFMTKFYSHLKRRESASTSLHQAMKEMKSEGRYDEPRHARGSSGFCPRSEVTGRNNPLDKLPTKCDEIPNNREEIPTPDVARAHSHLQQIADEIPELDECADILLLVGRDIPPLHKVHESRNGPRDAPWGQRLDLGWVVLGNTCLDGAHKPNQISPYKTQVLHNGRPSLLEPCPNRFHVNHNASSDTQQDSQEDDPSFNGDTDDDGLARNVFVRTQHDNKPGTSTEDRRFLEMMQHGMTKDENGSWEAPLPFRHEVQELPSSQKNAMKRLKSTRRSLDKKPTMKDQYFSFMKKIFEHGHAELVPEKNLKSNKPCWYLPHFGVYHPKKPDKIRVVFDSAAECNGISLNKLLLSGPDLTNSLLGVLLRFRQNPVAVVADIEQMFHSFKVKKEHRDFLRFLWYKDNDPHGDIAEYRMKVHIFGNTSSPAVANYGLRKTAEIGEAEFGSDAKISVERNFYVDDGLQSSPDPQSAIDLLRRTQAMLETANLRLHKIASSHAEVMEAFPSEDHANGLHELDFSKGPIPVQRSLGVHWILQSDSLTFRVSLEDKPFSRRGVLSIINSLYDPLGLAAPVTIKGKQLLRSMTADLNASQPDQWDTPLPEEHKPAWKDWCNSLRYLEDLKLPRSYSNKSLETAARIELHTFCDASEMAIGAVSYLKVIEPDGKVQVAFVLGKAKLTPAHATTIPRLELCAAVMGVELAELIADELQVRLDSMTYYSDSKVVLGYITNDSRRFYTYVSNRVERIRRSSTPNQWRYVSTQVNPADLATRSVQASDLEDSTWHKGPKFLHNTDSAASTKEGEIA
ncbi:hypothetical protein QZH41_004769 [Actinostola sp. cb2023]|nr:hypothetical protein QZH41_004769 [Actinostola sp. cb2023]